MATTATTPFPRLLAPAQAPSNPTAPAFLSFRRPPSLSFSCSIPIRRRLAAASKDTAASDKGQEQEPSTAADGAAVSTEEANNSASGEKSPEAVAAELKEVMRARKEAEAASGAGWLSGVTQEMTEIEWPAPGKVLGTTGVVLAIIAGSTVALLSVNAVLAELSDQVFAGRGVQDFFSG